jgi:hypothetical protein
LPFPGVTEGFDLVKKVWGVTGLPALPTPSSMAQFATRLPQTLPSMIAPTLDVDELDKRIADLRAVEQWLNLNLGMLRTTVQSLEVQRNTIATLKSLGGAMLPAQAHPASAPMPNWPYPAGQPAPGAAKVAATAAAAPEAPAPRRKVGARAKDAAVAAAAALPLNPVAWWNGLQEQFTRIATIAAAEAQAASKAAAAADKAAAKAAEKLSEAGSAERKPARGSAPAPKKRARRRARAAATGS